MKLFYCKQKWRIKLLNVHGFYQTLSIYLPIKWFFTHGQTKEWVLNPFSVGVSSLHNIIFNSFWLVLVFWRLLYQLSFSFICHLCSKKSYCGDQMLLLLWKKEREMRVLLFFVLTLKRIPREKASLSCFYYSLGEIPSDFTWCRIDSKCFYFIYGW